MYDFSPDIRPWSPVMASGKEYAAEYVARAAKNVTANLGGQWCGVVRPEGQIPEEQPEIWGDEAKKWSEAHTLDGPDCPGRRMLLEMQKARSLAAVVAKHATLPSTVAAPIKQVASRDDIDTTTAP